MDRDFSGSIDRIEWVAYLAAPKFSSAQLGNAFYYDFETRDLFNTIDADRNYVVEIAVKIYCK